MMESVNGIKYPASSYTIWLVSTVWRRKTSVLAVIVLTVLLVICLQYNVTKEIVEITLSRQEAETNDDERKPLPMRSRVRSVQFLGDEPYPTRDSLVDVVGRNNEIDYNRFVERNLQRRHGLNLQGGLKSNVEVPYVPTHRIIHLDMKGAPPKVAYLRKLFPMIKAVGATGVLLEWEDMFPWEDNLRHLAAKNAFSRKEVKEILSLAHKNKLEVIPAIQTFGHLEFALKNIDFAHLREVPESPLALCPSLNSSVEFVQDMIDQVMKIHGNTNFLHIGCDEVFNLGECSRCRKKLKDELFLSHVTTVAKYVRSKYNIVPIVWDDMLRHVPSSSLESFKIGELVEPMIWVYAEDVYRFVPQTVWEKYQSIFSHAWTASAFKGAFGETFYVPNAKRHLDNNMNWLTLMSVEEPRFKNGFRGITLTGWQRYDHFATLCELLPAALPSLVVSLTAVSHGYANNSLRETMSKALNCGITSGMGQYVRDSDQRSSFLDMDNDPFLWDQFSRCMFPGGQFYRMLYRWHSLEKEVNEYLTVTKTKKAWLTEYNVRRNFSVPFRVDELMADESRLYQNVLAMVHSFKESLDEIFDRYTIAEWIEQRLYPTVIQLEKLQKDSQRLKLWHTWPRRPLPPLGELQRIGVTVLTNSTGPNSDTA